MRRDECRRASRLLAAVMVLVLMGLDLGCAPKPVVPSGWRRVTINSDEAIANYHEHVTRTMEERQGRTLWQRQLDLLNQQVSELRGVVTYLQLKQQDYDRMRTAPSQDATERIPSRSMRPTRSAPREPPLTGDPAADLSERRSSELESRRAKPERRTDACVGATSHSDEGYARLWNDAFQRLSGLSQSATCGEGNKTGTKLVRVKPLSGPLITQEEPRHRTRTEAEMVLDRARPPMVAWVNAREKLEVRNHAVIFRSRPAQGVTAFTPSRLSQEYLKKAAAQSPFVEVRSYSDGSEGDQPVEDVTRTRAEVVRSYLTTLGVPATNIDLKVFPVVAHNSTGQAIPVKTRRVEIEFILRDPAQVYPAWDARRG